MDRDQAKNYLAFLRSVTPIIGAFARGEEVQSRTGTDDWRDAPNPSFKPANGLHPMRWRVKPIPVEVVVWVCRADHTEYGEEVRGGPLVSIQFHKGDKSLDAPDAEYASYWTKHTLKEEV